MNGVGAWGCSNSINKYTISYKETIVKVIHQKSRLTHINQLYVKTKILNIKHFTLSIKTFLV